MMIENGRFKMAYLLPNLFTAGSIFLAILAVVAATNGQFERAFWLVILSSVFDALDGRVARLTKTTSQFGKEFDSLADVIAFGMAPAFIFYFAIGADFGRLGVLISALYVIFGAVRLARFNVNCSDTEPNIFIGLPIPAAALLVVSWVLFWHQEVGTWLGGALLLLLMAATAVLMVSNIRYPSFKQVDFGKTYYLKTLVGLIVLLSVFYLYPTWFLPIVTLLYALLGPIRAVMTLVRKQRKG
jgi:CDP-diacylglycerol--serine O-phosphatidyltransferase